MRVTENADGSRTEDVKSWSEAVGAEPAWLQSLYEYNFIHNQVLLKESDRAAAVLSAAYIDVLLEELLKSYLVAGKSTTALLEGGNPPLGSFSSRIHAIHAMGLISDDTYLDLHRLREIRNEFAHRVDIHSLEEEPIASWIRDLRCLKRWPVQQQPPRMAFLFAASTLVGDLTRVRQSIEQRRSPAEILPSDCGPTV